MKNRIAIKNQIINNEIVIIVRGGNVSSVFSNNPLLKVEVLDYDNAECMEFQSSIIELENKLITLQQIY
jgi:hypothetical protein